MEFLEFFENLLEFSEKNEFWGNIFGKTQGFANSSWFSVRKNVQKKAWSIV